MLLPSLSQCHSDFHKDNLCIRGGHFSSVAVTVSQRFSQGELMYKESAFYFRRCHRVTVNFRNTRGKSNKSCEAHFIARYRSEEFRYDAKDHGDEKR